MAKTQPAITVFSGGEIGREVMSRVTLEGYASTGALMENFWPETSGVMGIRPGTGFLANIAGNPFTHLRRFAFSVSQKHILLLTNLGLRIATDGGIIVRPPVTSVIGDGEFNSLAAWTNISTAGATAVATSGQLVLTSNGTSTAGIRQNVTTSNPNVQHGFEANVVRGPVFLKIGSTSGGDELIAKTELRTGVHSLAFTPTGSYWVELTSTSFAQRIVERVGIAAAGDLVLATPWPESILRTLNFEQSSDVLYVASGIGPKKRIERRGPASWSVVDVDVTDGPFLAPNADQAFTLAPSATRGNGILTSNLNMFKTQHVGALFQLTHGGQLQTRTLAGQNQFTEPIKITGVGAAREFMLSIVGAFSGTITLQISIGNTFSWAFRKQYTAPVTVPNFMDAGFDNQIVYYRLGFDLGDYVSGTPTATLEFSGGSTTGSVRVTGYTSPTVVSMEVVQPIGNTTPTGDWAEGYWSNFRLWPKTVTLFDGRLWSGASDRFWGSVSENYESHLAGEDSARAISRSIATGGVNKIISMMGLSRLAVFTEGAEPIPRSSSFEEPITPTNLTVRDASTMGAADVPPCEIDTRAVFIERSKYRMMQLAYDVETQSYATSSLMRLHRDFGRPGIVQLAFARWPDPRIYALRSDGICLVKLFNPAEAALGWARMVTDGVIESFEVLPGIGEEEVYFMVRRTVNAQQVRYFEKLSSFYWDAAGDAAISDCHLIYQGAATTTITGLAHLEGRVVKVWADGSVHPDRTVVGGQITLVKAYSKVVVGLGYEARYRSSKLAYGAEQGTALTQKGRSLHISLILQGSTSAVEYGQDFDQMDFLPDRMITDKYDTGPGLMDATTEQFAVPGRHSRDPRLCLRARSPSPVRVAGYVLGHQTNERF